MRYFSLPILCLSVYFESVCMNVWLCVCMRMQAYTFTNMHTYVTASVHEHVFTHPIPHEQDVTHSQFVEQSTAGLNSEFSLPK